MGWLNGSEEGRSGNYVDRYIPTEEEMAATQSRLEETTRIVDLKVKENETLFGVWTLTWDSGYESRNFEGFLAQAVKSAADQILKTSNLSEKKIKISRQGEYSVAAFVYEGCPGVIKVE